MLQRRDSGLVWDLLLFLSPVVALLTGQLVKHHNHINQNHKVSIFKRQRALLLTTITLTPPTCLGLLRLIQRALALLPGDEETHQCDCTVTEAQCLARRNTWTDGCRSCDSTTNTHHPQCQKQRLAKEFVQGLSKEGRVVSYEPSAYLPI